VPGSRHGPNKLSRYLEIHHTWMHQLRLGDFVLSDGVELRQLSEGVFVLEGRIECEGGIYVDVWKLLEVVDGEGPDARVQTIEYSYNAALSGRRNIVRYDSPHLDGHRSHHHVHRYDTFADDAEGVAEDLDDEKRPTLGEVLLELREWYFENYEKLTPPG
jgi:hypothetical protein